MQDNTLFSSVPERWSEICDFPRYSVSDWGRVMNTDTGHLITPTLNSRGIYMVGLMHNSLQRKRALTPLVANAFLPPFISEEFDTPINLDGDPGNNHYLNLAWRPLWFARKYKKQFEEERNGYNGPIENVETYERYESAWHAAITLGLLEREIFISMANNTYVFPIGQVFRKV